MEEKVIAGVEVSLDVRSQVLGKPGAVPADRPARLTVPNVGRRPRDQHQQQLVEKLVPRHPDRLDLDLGMRLLKALEDFVCVDETRSGKTDGELGPGRGFGRRDR